MNFEKEMEEFENLTAELDRKGMIQEHFAENAFLLRGARPDWCWDGKDIGCLHLSLLHGNEVAGLAVSNFILKSILHGNVRPLFPMAFALGNVEAGYKGIRFVEKDLNRSFGTKSMETYEDRRAKKLEKILKRSCFLFDIHQTIEATETPFFIFGFEPSAIALAQQLASNIPIIAYNASDRKDHGVATIFANENKCTSVTLELGQKGFDPEQIALGIKTTESLIALLNDSQSKPTSNLKDILSPKPSPTDPLLTYGARIPNEDDAELIPGFINFMNVTRGQKIGNNPVGDILSPLDGKILFPKYGASKKGSKELCVILQEATVQAFL